MKIRFIKKYTDPAGKVFPRGVVWDIFKPVALQLINDKYAKAYIKPAKMVVVKSKIVTAKGDPVYVEKEVTGKAPEEDDDEPRIQGKDTD